MILLELFWSFFLVGLSSFGGGYASLPIMMEQAVSRGWLTEAAFTDLITISEMTPGPIALNAATFVGTLQAGIPGAIIATLGCVTAPCAISLVIAILYRHFRDNRFVKGVLAGLRPAVVGFIASAGLSIMLLAFFKGGKPSLLPADIDFVALGLFAIALFVLRKWKINPIIVLCGTGAAGLLTALIF